MIKISIPTVERDFGSGFDFNTTREFNLTISEAEFLARDIMSQLPKAKEAEQLAKQERIEQLERELSQLKGGAA